MVSARLWPDPRSLTWKIRDSSFVGFDKLTTHREFQSNRFIVCKRTRVQSFSNFFWSPGHVIAPRSVTWHDPVTKFSAKMYFLWGFRYPKNWRRCAPPFLSYSGKTGGGGGQNLPPPSTARVNIVCSIDDVIKSGHFLPQVAVMPQDAVILAER